MNDIFSFVALIIITFMCIRFFIGSIVNSGSNIKNSESSSNMSKRTLLADYLNNEDD